MNKRTVAAAAASLTLCLAGAGAQAQGSASEGIARYREMLQDGNPAELVSARARSCGRPSAAPKNVSLEQCDLGQGRASSRARTRSCRATSPIPTRSWTTNRGWSAAWSTLQGMIATPITKSPYSGAGQRQTDIEALAAYGRRDVARHAVQRAAGASEGEGVVRARQPDVLTCAAARMTSRARPATATPAQRIRLQDLPNLIGNKADADRALHDLAGLPRLAGCAADHAVAPVRLFPPAALARARVRCRRPRSP